MGRRDSIVLDNARIARFPLPRFLVVPWMLVQTRKGSNMVEAGGLFHATTTPFAENMQTLPHSQTQTHVDG